jgi:hypothetical protein
MKINGNNSLTNNNMYTIEQLSNENISNNIIDNTQKNSESNYIKELMQRIKDKKDYITNFDQLNEQLSLGLERINNIKTNNESVLDIKNQFIDSKFKHYPKYQDILFLINKKIKNSDDFKSNYINKNNNSIDSNRKLDNIDSLINSISTKKSRRNTFIIKDQKKSKIFDGILSSPPSSKPSKIKVTKKPIDKLYVSCIDGRSICNGKRTQINKNTYNLGRKSNYSTVIQNTDFFEENIFNLFKDYNKNKVSKRRSFKSGLNIPRKIELFNKDFYQMELNSIESKLFKIKLK